jgi:hypothetical protein
VAGRRTVSDSRRLEHVLPAVFAELQAVRAKPEAEFREVQDFEFTVQDSRLYLLQTRTAQPAQRTLGGTPHRGGHGAGGIDYVGRGSAPPRRG